MTHVISIEPVQGGWAVRQPGVENALLFASGAKAEAAARSLGERLSNAGQPGEIRVFLRDGALAGRFLCRPAAPAVLVEE